MRFMRIWFDDPAVRWRRVLTVVGAATALLALWLFVSRGLWQEEAAPRIAAVVAAVAPPSSAASVPRKRSVAPPVVAAAASVAASSVAVAAARPTEAVCGFGVVARAGTGVDLQAPDVKLRWRSARAQWLDAMQARGDERSRAAVALIVAGSADDTTSTTQRQAARERLVQLALGSADRVVLAFAQQACAAPGACPALPHDAWARVDGTNGLASLMAAASAEPESPARVDALARAAQAGELRSHFAELQTLALAAQPPGINELDRLFMGLQIEGIAAPTAAYELARDHCNAPALRDASRRHGCEALGELLAGRADTPTDLAMAATLGERLGWPATRVQALRDEVDALAQLREERRNTKEPLGCAALQQQAAYFGNVGRRGELAAQRELLQRSGRSAADLAAAARATRSREGDAVAARPPQ